MSVRTLALSALLLVPGLASAGTWKLDPTHSHVGFAVTHMMISEVEGEFGDVAGTLEYEPGDLKGMELDVTVQMDSVDTRNADRDAHLAKPDFLDVATFPTMTFVSKKVKPTGKDTFEVVGDLTIKGVTKEVVLEGKGLSATVKDPWGNTRVGANATGVIDRQDFGVSFNQTLDAGGVLVGDEVTLELSAEFIQQ